MSLRHLAAAALPIVLASCVSPAPPPPPPRAANVAPPPRPAPAPIPAGSDWRDWALTPGDWRYAREGSGTVARFGAAGAVPLLALRCDLPSRRLWLVRPGAAATALTIRTTSSQRVVPVQPAGEGYVGAALPATDPLFDAMGFSRGRFVVEQPGGAALVVPAWAEILRVAEDCRG